MKAPKWAHNEPAARTVSKTQRLLVLHMLQQMQILKSTEQKAEIAKYFHVSRWTIDRDLAALEKAQAAANETLARMWVLRD